MNDQIEDERIRPSIIQVIGAATPEERAGKARSGRWY
jgi:hypothetical protein